MNPKEASSQAANKQLQRTVQTASRRGARVSFHYARAPRFTRQRAAAELRRYADDRAWCRLLKEAAGGRR